MDDDKPFSRDLLDTWQRSPDIDVYYTRNPKKAKEALTEPGHRFVAVQIEIQFVKNGYRPWGRIDTKDPWRLSLRTIERKSRWYMHWLGVHSTIFLQLNYDDIVPGTAVYCVYDYMPLSIRNHNNRIQRQHQDLQNRTAQLQ